MEERWNPVVRSGPVLSPGDFRQRAVGRHRASVYPEDEPALGIDNERDADRFTLRVFKALHLIELDLGEPPLLFDLLLKQARKPTARMRAQEANLSVHGLSTDLEDQGGPAVGDLRTEEVPKGGVQMPLFLSEAGVLSGQGKRPLAEAASEARDPGPVRAPVKGAKTDEASASRTGSLSSAGVLRTEKPWRIREDVSKSGEGHPLPWGKPSATSGPLPLSINSLGGQF